jgi:hypothetical protein
MYRGYVKLWRKLEDSPIMSDAGLCQLFLWILLHVQAKPSFVYGVRLNPGQMIVGRYALAARLRQKPNTIRNRLSKLSYLQIIGLQSSNRFTIITLLNWDSYNGGWTTEGSDKDTSRTTVGQRVDTSRECKELEECKELKELNINTRPKNSDSDPLELDLGIPSTTFRPRKKTSNNETIPPSLEEVQTYCESRKNGIDPEAFIAHYGKSGWVDKNGNKIKSWRCCVITWEKMQRNQSRPKMTSYLSGGE